MNKFPGTRGRFCSSALSFRREQRVQQRESVAEESNESNSESAMSLQEVNEQLAPLPQTPKLPSTPSRSLPLQQGGEEAFAAPSPPSRSPLQSPSVSPRPAAGVGHTTAEESSTRFGIRKWWRLNIDSAKKWWETGVNDFNEQAAEALAKIRSQAAATEAAAEDNRASPAISEDHGSEGTSAPTGEEAGQGSVAAPADAEIGVADKWTRSLKTMQLQTATALQVNTPRPPIPERHRTVKCGEVLTTFRCSHFAGAISGTYANRAGTRLRLSEPVCLMLRHGIVRRAAQFLSPSPVQHTFCLGGRAVINQWRFLQLTSSN